MDQRQRIIDKRIQGTPAAELKRLRRSARPTGAPSNWVSRLSDRRLLEIYYRLRMGQSSIHIARLAKEKWGVMPNSSAKSLARMVNKFKKRVLGSLDPALATNDDDKAEAVRLLKREKHLSKKLDGLARLRWAINVQTNRINSIYRTEKSLVEPIKHLDRMMDNLRSMIDTYLEYEVKLGIREAKPDELNLLIKHRFEGLMSGPLAEGAGTVAIAANRFLQLAEENAMTMEEVSKGEYELPETRNGSSDK